MKMQKTNQPTRLRLIFLLLPLLIVPQAFPDKLTAATQTLAVTDDRVMESAGRTYGSGGDEAGQTIIAASYTVTTTADTTDVNPGDGLCADFAGVCSLRAAIQESNAFPGHDTIILPAGIYYLTIPGLDEDAAASGDLDITDDLTIVGAGSGSAIIDGRDGWDRILDIAPFPSPNIEVNISGVTIRLGYASKTDRAHSGSGGGILNRSGNMTLLNSTVASNYASFLGGGIANFAEVTLLNSNVLHNTGVRGGGGIYQQDGMMTISGSTIGGNIAIGNGGGINNNGGEMLQIVNSTVSENGSSVGAGIANFGTLMLTNSTISGNAWPFGAGGAVYNSPIGNVYLQNSILAANYMPLSPDCNGAPLTSHGYNILGNDTGCNFIPATGDQIGTANSPIDPKLGPLQNNGGPTLTQALLTGSPAIDTGNNAVCPDTDQRGLPRPLDGNGNGTAVCDVGAFELQIPVETEKVIYLPLVARP